ncbi:MAG: hypothetical protein M3P37_05470 [Actinomycetota bacterium]|nr:hypothetical protein [Actinomycetota bacterium]
MDIARWTVAFCHPARNRGIAVLLLDHVPHDNSHARGSTRKKDEVDVQWKLHNTKPFDRDSVGEIVLHREKDREGWLPPSVRFSVGGGKDGFVFSRSDGTLDEGFGGEAGAAGGPSANQRKILDVLAADFALTGATASEWQRATPGMSQATFYRTLRTIKPRADLVVEREGRYHPVTPPSGDDDSGRDSEETRSNSGDTGHYHPLSNHYHPNGDSGGNLLSPAITLYKSDSGDSSVTVPLSTATVAAEFARHGSGSRKNLPHFLRGDTTLEILTRSVLCGLGRDPERWGHYAALVDGAARDGRNHPEGCPCPLCCDVEVF